jgi:predicted O-methyltransferase YrrM
MVSTPVHGTAPVAVEAVVQRLVAERPSFHSSRGEARVWNALPGTLEMIARRVAAGDRTLETGAGASTVVFAAAGAQHLAISPRGAEHAAIRDYAQSIPLDVGRLAFAEGPSDQVLPALGDEPLDAAFIDGAHAFPYPMVDWHYIASRLRVGGVLMLDDVPIPSVAPVYRHMAGDPAWELLEVADDRAAAFRKLADRPQGDDWVTQPFNAHYPDYGFLPARARARREATHRLGELRRVAGRRLPRLKARLKGRAPA